METVQNRLEEESPKHKPSTDGVMFQYLEKQRGAQFFCRNKIKVFESEHVFSFRSDQEAKDLNAEKPPSNYRERSEKLGSYLNVKGSRDGEYECKVDVNGKPLRAFVRIKDGKVDELELY